MILHMRRTLAPMAALMFLAGALSACNNSGAPAATAGAATPSAAGIPATTAAGRDVAGFCAKVRNQKAVLQGTELPSLLAGGSPAAWKAYFAKATTMNQQLDAAAPADIKPSVDVLLKTTSDMHAALAAADYDVQKVGSAKLISLLSSPARKDASSKFAGYVKTNCGIDLTQP